MECLLTCDLGSDNTSLNLWNPSSGTKLLCLRGPSAQTSSLCNINDEGFAIAEAGKPFIHFWQTGHALQTSRRILCPGKPCAVAVSSGGQYFAVAIDEKISIWQVASGRIVATISTAHFRPVTVLKFNSNGTFLVSGGQDGLVHAWNFLQLVSNASSSSNSTQTPTYTWSDHSLPVTGIYIGAGGQKGTIYTSSLDRTCKIYSLITGTLLLSISFPIALTSIVADRAGNSVYIGAKNGLIYQIKLQSPPRSMEHHVLSDAAADFLFRKHTSEITTLAISADGKTLVSGDEEGNIHMWDVPSKQSIRTIQQVTTSSSGVNNSDGSKNPSTRKVTNIMFWLGNPENLKGTKKPTIWFPEVPKLLDAQQDYNNDQSVIRIWTRCRQEDESEFSSSHGLSEGYSAKLAEISKLKMELTKNQIINKKLHGFCTASILDLPQEKVSSKTNNISAGTTKDRKRKHDAKN